MRVPFQPEGKEQFSNNGSECRQGSSKSSKTCCLIHGTVKPHQQLSFPVRQVFLSGLRAVTISDYRVPPRMLQDGFEVDMFRGKL